MKKNEEIKKSLAEILELPKDIILDIPKITMVGNLQIYIENHKGIIEYSSNRVRINTKSGVLRIIGKNLLLKNIILEEIIIVGEIQQVEFTD
ncbi:sporulation protein YqfC [Clostridium formicaceticum]|uniref:Sporulation protein YqfC n=1 Tax=Clostridium formicaceticum TaxID=1497 RepID=A0AAC9RLZ6_9CLOT|nr:sporulation protein YqfC [Clostridium formicaceticum]AOY77556.1 sporulation protein YqfC [Clostridium formicaceticum]ARE88134.1 YabP family protein [Clostridium formicaceticum]